MRLRTDFWVAALLRRAEAAGAYVSVARKGAAEAGTVFVAVDRKNGAHDLYGPAPQSIFAGERPSERMFSRLLSEVSTEALRQRLDQELRFDSDLWLIEIEDRNGRPFVDVAT